MHKGKTVATKGKYKVIDCNACGFKHLHPIPSEEQIKKFYKKKYFELSQKGKRAPDIERLMKGGAPKNTESKWLKSTLYSDINYILTESLPRGAKKLCDIGCGTGDFLKYMVSLGWSGIGIEPSEQGRQATANSKLTIYNLSLEDFIATVPDHRHAFNAVTALNTLEHVRNPGNFLQQARKLLKPNTGIICIRVPNDFNKLQTYAEKALKEKLWWLTVPDHINYFNIESLQKLVESLGFEVLYSSGDFPMELFLLMGDDYIGNPKVGGLCHSKRVSVELSIPDTLRRKIYHNLSKAGLGRNCIVFAKDK